MTATVDDSKNIAKVTLCGVIMIIDSDLDECLSNPCTNKPGGYRCSCVTGWTGEHCDEGKI